MSLKQRRKINFKGSIIGMEKLKNQFFVLDD